ncbi:uncharacterized protein GBIM_00196 [Gryllus bimaculatus]|nr:uncharacterized protein GBIM_00196 [Gryllus bimaculatus]
MDFKPDYTTPLFSEICVTPRSPPLNILGDFDALLDDEPGPGGWRTMLPGIAGAGGGGARAGGRRSDLGYGSRAGCAVSPTRRGALKKVRRRARAISGRPGLGAGGRRLRLLRPRSDPGAPPPQPRLEARVHKGPLWRTMGDLRPDFALNGLRLLLLLLQRGPPCVRLFARPSARLRLGPEGFFAQLPLGVLSWLCKKGEETLRRHTNLATNLSAIKEQEQDFEKFYFISMSDGLCAALASGTAVAEKDAIRAAAAE